ncbi:prolyl 4-hydroxylase subunit alpha-2-like [Scaptodrosophila lebanonensis]|uniref:Prolyl 4-hydroxylase subunit alpha-2-like n=1 Tax=Drosophila lebanonensis TaxID=7225 RepID=A0A6J2T326_DROLE|nr:prolyl 4-hydroxylase subunit alpha-2-like [Scaptodrosophila lebanonensis]
MLRLTPCLLVLGILCHEWNYPAESGRSWPSSAQPALQAIENQFTVLEKRHRPQIALGRCVALLDELRHARELQSVLRWVQRLFDELGGQYLQQFDCLAGKHNTFLLPFARSLRAKGKIPLAVKLIVEYESTLTALQSACNQLIEGLFHETLQTLYQELVYPQRLIATEQSIVANMCTNLLYHQHSTPHKLRCRLIRPTPYHDLAPIKIETLHDSPYIAIFHQVIDEREAELLINKAQQNHILRNHQLPRNLQKKLSDFLGIDVNWLRLRRIEPVQPVVQHYDFEFDVSRLETGFANNHLTAFIYLNNAYEGGSTVFPYLNVAIEPRVGSLVAWQNSHKTLEPDFRTKHGSCPIFGGVKWVASFDTRSIWQKKLHLCDSKYDGYKSFGFGKRCNLAEVLPRT